MKKRKSIILLVLGLILLAVVIGLLCIGLQVASTANHALRISKLLQPMLDAENQAMHIAVSTQINGDGFDMESDMFLVSEEETQYLCIDRNDTAIYIADNLLLFENGKAFKIGDKMQFQVKSYHDFLPQIGMLFEVLSVTEAEAESKTDYCVTVTGEQVKALLATVSGCETLPADSIEKLDLCLTEKNGKLDRISFSGNGEMEDTPVTLHVTVSNFRILAPGDYPIPAAVKESVATVDPEELFSLTEDLYRLVLALAPLADMDTVDGTLDLAVDCGLLQLDLQLELSDLKTVSNRTIDPEKLQALPEMLGWLCMEGDIRCTQNGDTYVYTLALDQSSMKELFQMILPELAQYGGDFTGGSASITVDSGKITSMDMTIEGSVYVLITQIPIAVGAKFSFA